VLGVLVPQADRPLQLVERLLAPPEQRERARQVVADRRVLRRPPRELLVDRETRLEPFRARVDVPELDQGREVLGVARELDLQDPRQEFEPEGVQDRFEPGFGDLPFLFHGAVELQNRLTAARQAGNVGLPPA
jgi:hypothetical protein